MKQRLVKKGVLAISLAFLFVYMCIPRVDAMHNHTYTNGFCLMPECHEYEPAIINDDGYYEINNAGQLYWFASEVNSGNNAINGKLMNDIIVNVDLMSKINVLDDGEATIKEGEYIRAWTAIGNGYVESIQVYSGYFDGNGKTVSGLYDNEQADVSGLFGTVLNGYIENVSIIDSYFNGNYSGGIVGALFVGSIYECNNAGVVKGIYDAGGITGLVDYDDYAVVSNCYNTGTVIGKYEVGGIVGEMLDGNINNCYNLGHVVGNGFVGGLVGLSQNGKINNSFNTGLLVVSDEYTDSWYGDVCTGGVIGYGDDTQTEVNNCYWLDTACDNGIGAGQYSKFSTLSKMSTEQFASGEVAYLLRSKQSTDIWGQEIGVDNHPILNSLSVYKVSDCNNNTVFSNTNETVHFEKVVEGKIPTCIGTGLTEGIRCSACDTVIVAQNEIPITNVHNYNDGFCIECGVLNPDAIAGVRGYCVSLSGNIGVNYYMTLSDDVITDENAKVVFTLPNGSKKSVAVSDVAPDENGNYVFTCEVAAKEMTESITAQVITSDDKSEVFTYSVKEYAEYILASDDAKYEDAKPLVKAMLNYGAYAQKYFGYNTLNLANHILDDEDKALAEDIDLSEYSHILTDNDANVDYYGSKLTLESETAIKHYFTVKDEDNIPMVKVNGVEETPIKKDRYYEVKISDIPAQNLDEKIIVEFGDLTLDYNALSYANIVLDGNNTNLKNLMKALCIYNAEADAYTGK